MKYRQNIRQLIALLKGDRGKLVSILEKELQALTIKQKFEEAIVIRDRITSLNSIIVFRSFDNPLLEDNTKKESISAELEAFLKVHFDKSLNDSYRIECYDMSTLFGTNSTGSMVVFENGTFDHSKYRRFKLDMNIRSDFERVRHVLSRRFKHEDWPMPDLIVIDGGAPQISSSQAVLDDFKLKVPLIGFAKKPDRIVFVNKKIRSTLNHDSQLFKIFQQLRDESHRFAKKYHLLLRSKNLML